MERSGHGADLGRTALLRAFGETVEAGLPAVLPAPRSGLFELDRSMLTTSGTNVTIYAVHDFGLWPGEWGYQQSGQ